MPNDPSLESILNDDDGPLAKAAQQLEELTAKRKATKEQAERLGREIFDALSAMGTRLANEANAVCSVEFRWMKTEREEEPAIGMAFVPGAGLPISIHVVRALMQLGLSHKSIREAVEMLEKIRKNEEAAAQ